MDNEIQSVFLGVPCAYAEARAVILPVPFEGTVSYGTGTSRGPEAIIRASGQVELYDEETGNEPIDRFGVHTLSPVDVDYSAEGLNDSLTQVAGRHMDNGKFVLSLGGEHSITPGLVRAHAKRYPGLGVLQIDAHSDLRESYHDNRYSHASAMARSIEYAPVTAVGIRSSCKEELPLMNSGRYRVFPARTTDLCSDTARILETLPENVYLTFDIDGLDPSIVPGTGTPEPGGLQWYETLALLKAVAENRRIVGSDIVEVIPLPGSEISEFTAARLAYKILSYVFT